MQMTYTFLWINRSIASPKWTLKLLQNLKFVINAEKNVVLRDEGKNEINEKWFIGNNELEIVKQFT